MDKKHWEKIFKHHPVMGRVMWVLTKLGLAKTTHIDDGRNDIIIRTPNGEELVIREEDGV